MVYKQKNNHEHKRQLSQLNEVLKDFVIGNHNNGNGIGDETLELQTNSFLTISEGPQSVGIVQVKVISLKRILTTRLLRRLIVLL